MGLEVSLLSSNFPGLGPALEAGKGLLERSGAQPPATKDFVPFNDIAKNFDPYMPLKDYDAIREQYFWDVVHPRLPQSTNRTEAFTKFKEQTERAPLLSPGEKLMVTAGIGAAAHGQAVLEPLKHVPLAGQLFEKLKANQEEMMILARREGLPVLPEEMVGSFTGAILPLATLEKVAGPLTEFATQNAELSAKALSLLNRVGKGGIAFGAYNALSEEKGDYFLSGAKGFAVGAAWEFGLGLPEFLRASGVKKATKAADAILQGKPVPPEVDVKVAQKVASDSKVQKQQPYVFQTLANDKVKGARQEVKTKDGKIMGFALEPGKEAETAVKVQDVLDAGGQLGPLSFNPSTHQEVVNKFVKLATQSQAEVPPDFTVLTTAPGQAERVAKNINGKVVGNNKVAVPKLDEAVDLGVNPGPERIKAGVQDYLNKVTSGGGSSSELLTLSGQIGELWNPEVPISLKKNIVERLNRQAPGVLKQGLIPEKYKIASPRPPATSGSGALDSAFEDLKSYVQKNGRVTLKDVRGILVGEDGIWNGSEAQVRDTHGLYERAAREGIIDYNTGEAKFAPKTPPVRSDSADYPSYLSEVENEKLKELGYNTHEIKYLGEPAAKDILFGDLKNPRLEGKAEFELATLQELAKKYGFNSESITDESLAVANRLGKPQVEKMLQQNAIQETFDELARGTVPDAKVNLMSILQERFSDHQDLFSIWLRTPKKELLQTEPGDTVFGDLMENTVVQERPKGYHAVYSPEAEGEQLGITHRFSNIEKSAMFISEEAMKDPLVKRQTVYHEALHVDLLPIMDYFGDPATLESSFLGAGKDIGKGLASRFGKAYGTMSPAGVLEEAFVHLASAVRTGDRDYLTALAQMDQDVEHTLGFVKNMSTKLLDEVAAIPDSVYKRSLQRKLGDLVRRTDGDLWQSLHEFMAEHGVADIRDGKYVMYSEGGEKSFEGRQELLDYLDSNDTTFHSASFTGPLEDLGVRGPAFMAGKVRAFTSPEHGMPNPESLPESGVGAEDLGFLNISAAYRPFLSWAADADKRINEVLSGRGKGRIPLYDKVKALDEGVREATRKGDSIVKEVWEQISGIGTKKVLDYTQYLSRTGEDAARAAAQLGMSLKDVEKAEKVRELIHGPLEELLPGITNYVEKQLPTLRKSGYNPEIIWGKAKTPTEARSAGLFERAIRYEKTLDPKDEHIGRFLSWATRTGLERKYVTKPLEDLKALARKEGEDGKALLGPAKWAVDNLTRYIEGRPDVSQRVMNNFLGSMESKFRESAQKINKYLPQGARIEKEMGLPSQLMNKLLLLQYASGLAMRPIVYVRDAMQAFTALPVLGVKDFIKGMTKGLTHEGWIQAEKESALLGQTNVGEMWGDIFNEITPSTGKGWDTAIKLAQKTMAPARVSNNIGRAITYHGEYGRALSALEDYRAGKSSVDELFKKTSLWFFDDAAQSRLLKIADVRSGKDVGQAAREFALELVDTTQWPFRRGTQPTLMQTGAGRVFGLYGQWPMNYLDYIKRLGKKARQYPEQGLKAGGLFLAYNTALIHGANSLGADVSKWFMFSGASYGPSPTFDFVLNMARAPEESPEGKQARKEVLQYPLNFIPGSVAVRGILRASKGGLDLSNKEDFWRVMGARPYEELKKDQDLEEWVKEEAGFNPNPIYY